MIPWCLGISHFLLKDFKKNNLLLSILVLVLVFTTAKYHLRFTEDKKFMELENVDLTKAVDAKILDKSLKGLKWIHKKYATKPEYELKKLLEIKEIILKIKVVKLSLVIIKYYLL